MSEPDERRSRHLLAGLLAALFVAMFGYKVLHAGGLEQTAVFYVGIPAVIALTVALTAKPKSATGLIMAAITIGLALAGPLLGEGVVCLVFAGPIFYLVGLGIGLILDRTRKRGFGLLITPVLLLMVAEGTSDVTSLPRPNEVSATRQSTGVDIAGRLAATPGFGPLESAFLRLGFPRPLASRGEGLRVGAVREITFSPRRSLGLGAGPEPRAMTLRVTESSPGRVVFAVVEDTTLARWLDLREAEFAWSGDRLTVSLRYNRTFDPAWYFGPIQRYGLTQAADYLAATFTT